MDGGEKGVSPVVGVVLMVAITVILAGVVGTFVFATGDDELDDQPPNTAVSAEFHENGTGDDYVEFAVESGDSILVDRMGVVATKPVDVSGNSRKFQQLSRKVSFAEDANVAGQADIIPVGKQWNAGEPVYVGGNGDLEGETIRIVWNSQSFERNQKMKNVGESSHVLVEYTVPAG